MIVAEAVRESFEEDNIDTIEWVEELPLLSTTSGRDFSAIWNDLNKVHGVTYNPGFLSETNINLYLDGNDAYLYKIYFLSMFKAKLFVFALKNKGFFALRIRIIGFGSL